MNAAAVDRFWSHVDRSGGSDACWPWTAYKDRLGYGRVRIGGRVDRPHRVAWELTNGKAIGPLFGRHTCDNPSCCNPRHILPGTHADNMSDKVARGRQARGEVLAAPKRGDENPMRRHPERRSVGSRHGMSKLTEHGVVEIRRLMRLGGIRRDVARRFDVSIVTISDICTGRTWRHVPMGHGDQGKTK